MTEKREDWWCLSQATIDAVGLFDQLITVVARIGIFPDDTIAIVKGLINERQFTPVQREFLLDTIDWARDLDD